MIKKLHLACLTCGILLSTSVQAEVYTLSRAVHRLLDYYPTIQIARLKTDQANWEIRNVKNQLSWKLNGSAGVVHDVSVFGTPYDRFEANASINRKLDSGHSLGFSGRYEYNDDSFVLNNSFPNPSQSLDFDINYRVPFGQGENNTGYEQSLVVAESQKAIEQANEKAILKSLVANIITFFHEIDNLKQRLVYTDTSIDRSRRLKQYITRNKKIGIYEEKDVLESEAQLLKVIAERENLYLAISEQKNSLRRLLGIEPDALVDIKIERYFVDDNDRNLLEKAEQDDPGLQIKKLLVDIADARIKLSLDENTDKKDLVFSLGARTLYGDSQTDNVSEEDYAAQLKFEYQYDLGNDAYTSRIEKAKRDKDITLQEMRLNKDEVKYQLTSLQDRIKKQRSLIEKLKQHNKVSAKKYNEAMARYRQGRIDTTKLIQFENDLHLANLDLSSAQTELSKSETSLALLVGDLLSQLNVYSKDK
ncbi:MAG: TolC family protein [Gammaproteobacteria bacterium]